MVRYIEGEKKDRWNIVWRQKENLIGEELHESGVKLLRFDGKWEREIEANKEGGQERAGKASRYNLNSIEGYLKIPI
jgi:hypothetical protein